MDSAATSTGRRMAQNLMALLGGRGVSAGLQLICVALLAAYLGPREFGIYSFAVSFALLFRIVPNFGIQPIVLRDVAQDPESESYVVPNVVYFRFILGVAAFGLLAVLLKVTGYEVRQTEAALIAGALLFLLAIDSFQISLQVRMQQGWVAVADVVEGASYVLGVLTLMALDAELLAFMWLHVAVNLLNVLLIMVASLRKGTFVWRMRPGLMKPIMRAAAPLALANLFIALYFRIDMIILARLAPADDVGQYGAAYKLLEAFLLLPSLLMAVLAPILARSFREGPSVFQRRYARAIHLMSLLAVPLSVAGGMVAWRLLPAVPGFSEYGGGGIALSILSPAAGLAFMGYAIQGALISGHKQQRLLRVAVVGTALNVGLNLFLIPRISFIGAAIATVITEIVVVTLSLRLARSELGLRVSGTRLGRTCAATTAMALVLGLGFFVHPFIQVAAGALAFAFAAVRLNAVTREDLEPFLPRDWTSPGSSLA